MSGKTDKTFFRRGNFLYHVKHAVASVGCLVILCAGIARHEYYVSITQIQYNAASGCWEISLKVFTDDMELALSGVSGGERLVLRNGDRQDSLVKAYLDTHFRWRNAQGRQIPLSYVGKEQEADATWIYFKVPAKTSILQGVKLQHSLLMEIFDTQVNIVNIKTDGRKKTYLFKKGSSRQVL